MKNQIPQQWLLLLCIALGIIFSFKSAQAADQRKASSKRAERRILEFPKTFSLGELELVQASGMGTRKIAEAKGKISVLVPPGFYLQLDAGKPVSEDPSRLEQAPSQGIDSLKLRFISLDEGAGSICDKVLKHASHFKNLTHLSLRQSDITDLGLAAAQDLPKLQEIDLFTTEIHGLGLQYFTKLKDLNNLDLSFNGLESSHLHFLGDIPNLRALNIKKSGVNRQGIRQIARCKNLESLVLSGNRHVEDDCMNGLLALNKLHSLELNGTSVTKVGILKLTPLNLRYFALPQCIEKSDMAELHKAFPHTSLEIAKQKEPTKEEKEIFAPLK